MPEMTGGQALVSQLRAEEVDTIFGLPGVQIMAAFDALYEQRNAIKLIHTRHEQATTYMADGYARVTGKPGVALVVPGPGALNATAGLGTAYAASSPVLLISGQIASDALGKRRGELHEVEEQLDVFRPITKWCHRVTRVEEIPEAVHEAFRQLKTGRPRPVELEVPPDTLLGRGEVTLLDPEDPAPVAPDPEQIARAAALLAEAERPAIVAGGGIITADAAAELIATAELLQAPVMTTQQSKGAIAHDHPLHLGVNYIFSQLQELLEKTDVLLAVGTRLSMRGVDTAKLPKLVQIDADPSEIGKSISAEVGIEADAKLGLEALVAALRERGVAKPSRGAEVTAWRNAFREKVAGIAPLQIGMIDSLREILDDDDVLVSGVTNLGYWSNIAYPSRGTRNFITSNYFGTLGYAFPTALGAKIGAPDRRVVALCGDGGFLFSPQELSTAARYGIDMVAIVFNNHAYGASRWDQEHRFEERYIGTDLKNPDFQKLAEAFGVKSLRCNPDSFAPTLKEALDTKAPVLMEVEVPIMVPPFQVV